MGFLVICAGVIILQLSKSAKDVPDAAVFSGDLDQIRTIAEQEQPESEPKADAIRGTAAIVRRFSQARQRMEVEEAKRLHTEKLQDLEPIGENERIEWDGLRRRRTTYGSRTGPPRTPGENSQPFPSFEPISTPQQHPPLGMSRMPDPDSDSDGDEERPRTGASSSFLGSFRERARSVVDRSRRNTAAGGHATQSPMPPVPLTEISVGGSKRPDMFTTPYFGPDHARTASPERFGIPSPHQKTEYEGAGGERHVRIFEEERTGSRGSLHRETGGPTPPPHSARRQFSFQNVFRKGQNQAPQSPLHPTQEGESSTAQGRVPVLRKTIGSRKLSHTHAGKGATEEERLGLVKGDTQTGKEPTQVEPDEDEDDEYERARQQYQQEAYSEDLVRQQTAQLSGQRDLMQRRESSPPPMPPPHDKTTLGKSGGRSGGSTYL